MAAEPNVLLRLSIIKPVTGVTYSLHDKNGKPVDAHAGAGRTLVFEIPARLEDGKTGPRFLGDFVRTEGKTRRFVYVATGLQAGQTDTVWSRRAKVDLPEVTPAMAKKAAVGQLTLEADMQGADAKGEPACATVKVAWSVRG